MARKLSSRDIAILENISQRTVNFMKDREDFPDIEWIGRTWRVDEESYKTWKALACVRKSDSK